MSSGGTNETHTGTKENPDRNMEAKICGEAFHVGHMNSVDPTSK